MTSNVSGMHVVIISRCARTLFNFRRSLMEELVNRNAVVTAMGAGGDGFGGKVESCKVRFHALPLSTRSIDPIADIRLLVGLIRTLRRSRPTVVHCFTVKPAVFGTLAAAIAGVPVRVVTITGLGHAFGSAPAFIRIGVTALYRLSLRYAHKVFFQNCEDRDYFLRLGLVDSTRVGVVPGSGVDLDRFMPEPLPSAQSGSLLRFTMIARLIREKGVWEYLEAAAMVRRRHPTAHFTLVGGTDPRNPTSLSESDVRRLERSNDLQWVGEVDDVRPHLRAADVVVLPSYREGLPRSLLEAAAAGRAVIATDTVGCRDAVIDGVTGYLVPPRDSSALAEAMCKLIARPSLVSEMGRRARERAEQLFSETIVINRTLEAYSDLLQVTR